MAQPTLQTSQSSVREIVRQTVVDLHVRGRAASRTVLHEITGLRYSVIDDHVKRMIEDGKLRRVSNGIFEPVEELPAARPVSFTKLPNGIGKLEVGDFCLDLVPSEERTIGQMLAGSAREMSGMQNARELADAIADVNRELQAERAKRQRLEEHIRRIQRKPSQGELPL